MIRLVFTLCCQPFESSKPAWMPFFVFLYLMCNNICWRDLLHRPLMSSKVKFSGMQHYSMDLIIASCCSVGTCRTHGFVVVLLLLQLLHHDGLLLVLAALVLKPDANHPGAQAGHLHKLLLHQSVRSRVGVVARPQGVQLLFVQHCPDPGGLLGLLVNVVPVMRRMAHRDCVWGEGKTIDQV